MKQRGKGFYVFCMLCVCLVAAVVWAVVSTNEPEPAATQQTLELGRVEADVPPANKLLESSQKMQKTAPNLQPVFDETKWVESLEAGAIPTQEVGELGSKEGALITDSPMVYAETKYERLPDSPLLIFTDDMIWPSGEGKFSVKKDAMIDQAKHYQEASIALSISPRVEMEQTKGYRLVEIPENTLFAKMGMVSGDIIVSINGTMPDIEPMALAFINMVAGKQGKSTVVVEHRGQERTIVLEAVE